jgi:arabinose-5-phosphate isomerase
MQVNFEEIIFWAKKTLKTEGEAVLNLQNTIDNAFAEAVKCVLLCQGRLVVAGIGKSAIIAQKMVATLNSTGTPALFLHAAEAIHGDFGTVQPTDVVLCISQSGNTPEIKKLAALIYKNKNKIIAITGNTHSYLATKADYVILSTIDAEACPLNLAPTTSTTAQLALCDALAVCLMHAQNFTPQDFARTHPGGALGKKLTLTVLQACLYNAHPQVFLDTTIQEIIFEISSKRIGATAVLNAQNQLQGIITDGDLRRAMHQNPDLTTLTAQQIYTKTPKTINQNALATHALHIMQQHNITQLIITDDAANYKGFVHIHDLIAVL